MLDVRYLCRGEPNTFEDLTWEEKNPLHIQNHQGSAFIRALALASIFWYVSIRDLGNCMMLVDMQPWDWRRGGWGRGEGWGGDWLSLPTPHSVHLVVSRAHKCDIKIFLDLGFLHFFVLHEGVWQWVGGGTFNRPFQSFPVTHCRVPRTTKDPLAHRTEKSEVW